MSSHFSRSSLSTAALAALFALGGGQSPSTETTSVQPISPELRALAHDGTKEPLKALEREIAAAGNDATALAALGRSLVAALSDPQTSSAARQYIAEQIGKLPASAVLTADSTPVFRAMLLDDAQVNLARLALDRQPGASIDKLLLEALDDARTETTRIALVQSLGQRQVTDAVTPLARLSRDQNPAVAAAAVKALSLISTQNSLRALQNLPETQPHVLAGRIAVAGHVGGAEGIRALRAIHEKSSIDAVTRAVALRELLFAEPALASERLARALKSASPAERAVLVESIVAVPGASIVPALGAALPSFPAETQAAVLEALGQRGEATAVPFVAEATSHADPNVRAAALTALGYLPGNPDTAMLLARLIARGESADAKVARSSLARLSGPGVADVVINQATRGETSLRVVFIEQLASRYTTEAVPLLLGFRQDPSVAVRIAALNALADLAPGSEQATLLDWTLAAEDTNEQARALRALANVSLRIADPAARAQRVAAAIEQAEPAVALRMLPVLGRIGGTQAAESASRLALRDQANLASAAVTTLSRWTDPSALVSLVSVAERSSSDSIRAAAWQSATRLLERFRSIPSNELTTAISRLLNASDDIAGRRRLVYLLGRANDEEALSLATRLQSDENLRADATDAALAIRANRAGKPVVRTSTGAWALKNLMDGALDTHWTTSASAGHWIELDFHLSRPIRQVVLDGGNRPDNIPAHVEIYVTDDLANPGPVRASGNGQRSRTVIDLPRDTHGRYLIIRHTETREDGWWSVAELLID